MTIIESIQTAKFAITLYEVLTCEDFSDKYHIYMKGMQNKQNFRKCSPTKSNDFSPKITVWCGLSENKNDGPFFFDDPESKRPQSINTGNYHEPLTRILMNGFSEMRLQSTQHVTL